MIMSAIYSNIVTEDALPAKSWFTAFNTTKQSLSQNLHDYNSTFYSTLVPSIKSSFTVTSTRGQQKRKWYSHGKGNK